MKHELPQLPFARYALKPWISAETLVYHHDKHHKKYVDQLNLLIEGTDFEEMALVEIVRASKGSIFDNAAQAWNHTFFWHCLSPDKTNPSPELHKSIEAQFKSLDKFYEAFKKTAATVFGSGWVWLSENVDGTLTIETTQNAANPLVTGKNPLLACDLWEHAYYIDYRNERDRFVDAFFKVVNWDFASRNLKKTHGDRLAEIV